MGIESIWRVSEAICLGFGVGVGTWEACVFRIERERMYVLTIHSPCICFGDAERQQLLCM